MSRIFLVSMNTCSYPCEAYPLGMAVIGSALQRVGHDIRLYDYLAAGKNDKDLVAASRNYRPDFICVSIRNLDDDIDSSLYADNTARFRVIGSLVKRMKDTTGAVAIVGGPGFSLMPEAILVLTCCDYGIVGEGEKAVCRLIVDIQSDRHPQRLIYGGSNPAVTTDICGGLYSKELVDYYYKSSGAISIQTKRGCPFQCAYCTYPSLEGHQFRYRDVSAVIEEIQRLKNEFGCEEFFFADSVFNDPAGKYKELLDAMIEKKLNIRWAAYFTPSCVDEAGIELCRKAGLYAIELGTDAACSRTLAGLKKSFCWGDVVKANNVITGAGIACAHFVMFAGPDETYETLEEGIENCLKLEKGIVFGCVGIRLYPDGLLPEN